ncbi:MAG: SpoIID/LytB domain-containing protein [Thermodesulfovibrionales bacterium]|nr:SpoIID/LytB domain-containing protein [Thermodesulfovibrionales bacterium]
MKRLLIAAGIVFLMLSTAASETIKVLILDGNFKDIPEKGEHLGMLDTIKGELLVGYTRYKGNIEVWQGKDSLYLVSEIPMEEYVEGVVSSELGKNWEIEAIKAQAVVARTYALNLKMQNKDRKFHLTSTVLHQVFKGGNEDAVVSYGVQSTKGEVLAYNGRPIEAYYHSTCGGMTEEAGEVFGTSRPYLRPVASECNLSPYQMWSRKMPFSEIEKALGIKGMTDIRIKSRTSTGRVKAVAVITDSNHTIEATELRRKLGWKRLPSTDFSVKVNGDSVFFDGKGYGHGVGLCQWGSLEMARKGKTYKEILQYYFPGAAIELYESPGF